MSYHENYTRAIWRIYWVFVLLVIACSIACVPPRGQKEHESSAAKPTADSPLPKGANESNLMYSDPKSSLRLYCTGGIVGGPPLALHIIGASDRVHSLASKPQKRESELEKGTWLVVAVGVFSGSDVKSAVNAIQAIESRTDGVQLGVRPFKDYDESETWFGPYGDIESPLWVIFKDSKIIHSERGTRTQTAVTAMVEKALAK